jgi:methylenetetrahydrofolate dehydrogenase (NADP+) / methenyltetrahydrofolate cyclohydrolase
MNRISENECVDFFPCVAMNANATVTVFHSRTSRLSEMVISPDILVGAVGKPEFIKWSWIRDGAIVVEAGYHPGNLDDVELSAVTDRCAACAPVPGGVGSMTIASPLAHTVEATEKSI